ncbi:MAG: hypothetical protein Q8J64_09965 [Thermodesulfovibrionales bacterium]|nr:hypothetical protein [Thermodesulfovibrionales bacterium]
MASKDRDKVVIRLKDGTTVRGYLESFSDESKSVAIEESGEADGRKIPTDELKAIFFVRSFEGDSKHREEKSYGKGQKRGRKIYVRFHDNESLMGYLESEMSRQKGFYLSKPNDKKTGFFVLPVDSGGNNIRVYVFHSAVKDVASIG